MGRELTGYSSLFRKVEIFHTTADWRTETSTTDNLYTRESNFGFHFLLVIIKLKMIRLGILDPDMFDLRGLQAKTH